jgi:16S rRNA (guanine966-N2)-methyltransferase
VTAIERNLDATGLAGAARVQRSDVARFLGGDPPEEAPFTLAFLDPPYATATAVVTGVLEQLAGPGWLAAGATVVVERGAGGDPPVPPTRWATTWERAYGDTLLTVATAVEPTA